VKTDDVHATYHDSALDVTVPLPATMVAKKIPPQI
jgi:hypothetical protein